MKQEEIGKLLEEPDKMTADLNRVSRGQVFTVAVGCGDGFFTVTTGFAKSLLLQGKRI